jgi:hypothetical protein
MNVLDPETSSDEEYFPTAEDPDDLEDDLIMEEELDEEELLDEEHELDEHEDEDEDEAEEEEYQEEEEEDEMPEVDVERMLRQSNPNLLRQIQQVLQHGITSRLTSNSPHIHTSEPRPRIRRRLQEIARTPFPEGKRLLNSGEFGVIDDRTHKKRRFEGAKTITQFARFRELGAAGGRKKQGGTIGITKRWLPGEMNGRIVAQYDRHVYSGQFSHDGSFFYTASQDFKCRMYSTPNPAVPQDWRLYKVPPRVELC